MTGKMRFWRAGRSKNKLKEHGAHLSFSSIVFWNVFSPKWQIVVTFKHFLEKVDDWTRNNANIYLFVTSQKRQFSVLKMTCCFPSKESQLWIKMSGYVSLRLRVCSSLYLGGAAGDELTAGGQLVLVSSLAPAPSVTRDIPSLAGTQSVRTLAISTFRLLDPLTHSCPACTIPAPWLLHTS